MAVFSQTDPLLYRNLATLSLGGHGGLRSICFARWLFFSQTPDSIFGVFVFADDRFTEPTFVEGVAVGRVFTKEELFNTGRRLRARAVALGSIFAVCFTSSPLPDQWPGAFKALARWSGRGLIIMQDSKNRT